MTNILGAVEYTKREAIQKIPRGQVASHWSNCEASSLFQELGDVLELWYVALSVAAVFLYERPVGQVLATRVCRIQRGQLLVDHTPCLYFLFGVLYVLYWLTTLKKKNKLSQKMSIFKINSKNVYFLNKLKTRFILLLFVIQGHLTKVHSSLPINRIFEALCQVDSKVNSGLFQKKIQTTVFLTG